MLIKSEDIQCRFRQRLKWANKVDLATAWATNNAGLRDLRERQKQRGLFSGTGYLDVRAIVGLYSNITAPEALRTLMEIGNLRIVDKSRLFHPKIYIFRRNEEAVAWIGSANFTSGGFGANEELMFETEDTRSIQEWFESRWGTCCELQPHAIDVYEHRRKQNPNPLPRFPQPAQAYQNLDHPYQFLHDIADWNGDWKGYLYALEECNNWWASNEYGYTVFGEPYSWHNTILDLHDVIKRNLIELDEYNQRRLLGLTDVGSGLLGNMSGSGNCFNTVFRNIDNLDQIQRSITHILEAHNNEFPDIAIEEYENIRKIRGIGKGIASRLMALARPDRIVSLNGGSVEHLAIYFGLDITILAQSKLTHKHIQNYHQLLVKLYDKEWFGTPQPGDPYGRSIWSMRAALIDCFVYQPS